MQKPYLTSIEEQALIKIFSEQKAHFDKIFREEAEALRKFDAEFNCKGESK